MDTRPGCVYPAKILNLYVFRIAGSIGIHPQCLKCHLSLFQYLPEIVVCFVVVGCWVCGFLCCCVVVVFSLFFFSFKVNFVQMQFVEFIFNNNSKTALGGLGEFCGSNRKLTIKHDLHIFQYSIENIFCYFIYTS